MTPQDVKDIIDTIASVGTVIGFITVGIMWYISRRESKAKGELACDQINAMATNHFPHMQADLTAISQKTETTNEILRRLELGQVETNTILRRDKYIAVETGVRISSAATDEPKV
jgi:hypothetical protein